MSNVKWPKELSFEILDAPSYTGTKMITFNTVTVIRVTAPGSGNLVGYITRGYIHDSGSSIVGPGRWYVAGHEDYASFPSPDAAAWALRDYYLGYVIRARVITELKQNDGHEGIVKRMKDPVDEKLAFKKRARKKRKELFDDLGSANAMTGITFH